jgi:hypothetical protein
VFDGLFDEQFIRMVHHFMARLQFALSDYDTDDTKNILHWKHEFNVAKLPPLPLIPELISKVTSVVEKRHAPGTCRLARIHCNLHLYGNMQHPHTDLSGGVTALYFANPSWQRNWMGETIFYGDDEEPLYAIVPKPGRLVVFDADIVHRAGVPSRECFEPRISVAFKFLKESVS